MANSTTTYDYDGPISGATIREDSGEQREIMLLPGEPIDLVPDHPYTKLLLSQGFLTESVNEKPKTRRRRSSPAAATSAKSTTDEEEKS